MCCATSSGYSCTVKTSSRLATTSPPGWGRVLVLAWPIILANCATPLLGLVDTAVIGHSGQTHELGAIALGALIFSFLFWAFGFLRMGTSGFAARAAGQGDSAEERAVAQRGLLLGGSIGMLLLCAQWPLSWLALNAFDASETVEASAHGYIMIRIWSAPATLAGYVVTGWLIGVGRTSDVLRIQLLLNGLNIVLDVLFAGAFGWGVKGIALGTVMAEWLTLGFALYVLATRLRGRRHDVESMCNWSRIAQRDALLALFSANRDLMIRTLLMLGAFAAFTNAGARFGDTVLAANHVLLQLISFSAFFLDGFAFAAEGLIGQAIGARRLDVFDAAVLRSSCLSALTAGLIGLLLYLCGDILIAGLTDLSGVQAEARRALPWVASYVALSFAAFQLDGIFIGASRTASMRDASILSVLGFGLCYMLFGADQSTTALWLAFVCYVVLRALTLLAAYPRLRRAAFASA